MQEQLISFETAKLAKEKGFNVPSNSHYLYNTVLIEKEYKDDITQINKHIYKCCFYDLPKELLGLTDKWAYLAPTQSLLQKWLREEHKIQMLIQHYTHIKDGELYAGFVYNPNIIYCASPGPVIRKALTYEQALEICLQEALKLI